MSYNPSIHLLPQCTLNMNDIDFKDSIVIAEYPKPLLTLGFNPYIYEMKDKMADSDKFNKLELNIVNRIDVRIKNYNKSLSVVSSEIFPDDYRVITRAFYKLWEIMTLFNLMDVENFTGAFLCESPGSFVQSALYYRKFHKLLSKKDHFYVMSLDDRENRDVPKLEKTFIGKYNDYITDHPTDSNGPDNGDITKALVRNNFQKHFDSRKEKAHLVTADAGKPWMNENLQEQEAFILILSEACLALRCQAKGGNFVLKIFESFTMPMVRLIYLLKLCYENVYIYKPLTSHDTNSEKYLICCNFKDNASKIVESFESIIISYNKSYSINKMSFITEFFYFNVENSFLDIIRQSNLSILELQCTTLNNSVQYMERKKGQGDFEEDREKQIENTKLWLDIFFVRGVDKKILNRILKAKTTH